MTDSTCEVSKLKEQATGKAELSYSYWAANEAKDAPLPEAKQLTEEEAQNVLKVIEILQQL